MEWRKIFHDLYEVSENGRVRRIAPWKTGIIGQVTRKPKEIKLHKTQYGYLQAVLSKDSVKRYFQVHRLVAEAFIGPCPDNYVINHKDGNKANNHYSNLEWVTQKNNIKHSILMNKHPIGSKNGMAILTEDDVKEIKKAIQDKTKRACDLADEFCVDRTTISAIKRGKNWQRVSIS